MRTSAEEDEKASRVKALEEMVKLGQMERTTFEALRDEIVGGDVKDVHLVKGLDYKLLQRVRKGEDVLAEAVRSPKQTEATAKSPPADSPVDVDDEFEKLEEREFQPAVKQENIKKGEMAPPPLPPSVAGKKRTRDDILKELKASRQAAAAKAEEARQPALGSKFHKIGVKQATSRIEIDAKGREILITVDADGNVKRKVKKVKPEATNNGTNGTNGLLMPDKDAKPLGLDVLVPSPQASIVEQEDDGDIFEGVGADYDPLGGELANDASSSSGSEDEESNPPIKKATKSPIDQRPSSPSTDSTPLPKHSSGPKNYFNDPTPPADGPSPSHPLKDPTILAALKKASTLDPLTSLSSSSQTSSSPSEAEKLARRKRLLQAHDRDAEDMDMGFGSSRFEDEEDGEGKRVKLSVWGGEEEGEGRGEGRGKEKRKRGPKKGKKGDKNSAVDVLKVMERRKREGK